MNRDNARLNMNLLKKDKDALKELAIAQGETMSVIIRRLIRKELEEYEKKQKQNNNNK